MDPEGSEEPHLTDFPEPHWPLTFDLPAAGALGSTVRNGIAALADTESWELRLQAVVRPERFDDPKAEAIRRADLIGAWWKAQPHEPPLSALGVPMTPLAIGYRSVVRDVTIGWLG